MGLIGLIISPALAADVFFHFEDGAGVPQANRSLSVYPVGAPVTNSAGIVTRDRFTRTTDVGGNVTVSNIFGWAYRSEFAGTYGTTTNWYSFPVTNGLVLAKDCVTVPTNGPGGIVTYSRAQSDARFAVIGIGGDKLWGTNSASGYVTNAGAGVQVVGGLTPTTDGIQDFGGQENAWRNLYVQGAVRYSIAGFPSVNDPALILGDGIITYPSGDPAIDFANGWLKATSGDIVLSFGGLASALFAGRTYASNVFGGGTLPAGTYAAGVAAQIVSSNLINSLVMNAVSNALMGLMVPNNAGAGTNNYFANPTLVGAMLKVVQASGTHAPTITLYGTNYISSGGKHVTVTAGSSDITSTDGAFAGFLPGDNIEFPDGSPHQVVITEVYSSNRALGYQVEGTWYDKPTGTQTARTDWNARTPPMRWTDNAGNFGGWIDCNGQIWGYGIGDQAGGTVYLSTDHDGTLYSVSVARGVNWGMAAKMVYVLGGMNTNAGNFAGNSTAPSVVFSGDAPNESLDLDDSGTLRLRVGIGGWHGGTLQIPTAAQATNLMLAPSSATVIGNSNVFQVNDAGNVMAFAVNRTNDGVFARGNVTIGGGLIATNGILNRGTPGTLAAGAAAGGNPVIAFYGPVTNDNHFFVSITMNSGITTGVGWTNAWSAPFPNNIPPFVRVEPRNATAKQYMDYSTFAYATSTTNGCSMIWGTAPSGAVGSQMLFEVFATQ